MGLFDFLNKPNPQEISKRLKEAVSESEALAQRGDKDNALKVLLGHKDLGWNDADYVMHIAAAYYIAGNNHEAVECNKRAAELNPEYGRIYINMGRAYFALNDHANAVSSYAQAIKLIEEKPQSNHKSDYPIACAWYGASLVMTGKREEGESFIRKAEVEGYQKGNEIRQFVGLTVNAPGKERAVKTGNAEPGAFDTPRIRELYQELANIVFDMIPEKWSMVYLYGEVLSDSRTAYFFYRRSSDKELIYSHDIPEKCNVDKRIYDRKLITLLHCLADLNKEHAVNFEKEWTNLTFILESNGKFNITYKYDDVLSCEYRSIDRQKIWMYEVMGVEPKDEKGRNMLQKYLDSDRFLKL